jgi:feruloyl-CoA synthase
MAGTFETTVANVRDVPVTAYFNVPKGYEMLIPRLRSDDGLREHFFANVRMLFCAAASMRQQIADEVLAMAATAGARRIPLVTGLGATETAPFALCAGDSEFGGGRIGVPAPGVELKLAPVGNLYEARIKGPNVTPGYWRDPELTSASFDDEGFYKMGDAIAFYDAADPSKGFTFQGRLSEDFKLSTGTWVRVGPLRDQVLQHFGELVQNVVIAGHARGEVTALAFPSIEACRALCGPEAKVLSSRAILERPEVRAAFAARLSSLCARNAGNSTAIPRMILLDEPPSIDAQELTDKGSVNQKQVLANRAPFVEQLYGADGPGILIAASTSVETLD